MKENSNKALLSELKEIKRNASELLERVEEVINNVEPLVEEEENDEKILSYLKYAKNSGIVEKAGKKWYSDHDKDECEVIDDSDFKDVKSFKKLASVYPVINETDVLYVLDRYDASSFGGEDKAGDGWLCVTEDDEYVLVPSEFLDEEKEEELSENVCICGIKTMRG